MPIRTDQVATGVYSGTARSFPRPRRICTDKL